MAVKFICDGCGKEHPGISDKHGYFKPPMWFQRVTDDGVLLVCSLSCRDKLDEDKIKNDDNN